MLLKTIDNETVEVDSRDITGVSTDGAVRVRTLVGDAGFHIFRLTVESAAEVRQMIAPQLAPRAEKELFDLAANFSRRQVMGFRVPGTTATHQVECVVMEPSDVAMFASAIGVPTVMAAPGKLEPTNMRRRLADHADPEEAADPLREQLNESRREANELRAGVDHMATLLHNKEWTSQLFMDTSLCALEAQIGKVLALAHAGIPQTWRDFVQAIANLPAGAEPNLNGMRDRAAALVRTTP